MTQTTIDFHQKQITDVLGRTRPVEKVYPDGAWNCPFCGAAVSPERDVCRGRAGGYTIDCGGVAHCPNPACFANPHTPVAHAREQLAAAERRAEEERQRKETHDWAMKRGEEERQARAARVALVRTEAETRGACVTCALHSLRFGAAVAKFTKHRGACPREKGRPGPWDV